MRRFAPHSGVEASTARIVERSHPDCRKPVRCSFRFNRVTGTSASDAGLPVGCTNIRLKLRSGGWKPRLPTCLTARGTGRACAAFWQGTEERPKPAALQSTTPDKPPVANVPKAATGVAGVPRRQTTGQAPNVSKRIGAEMDSAGDQRASPDEE